MTYVEQGRKVDHQDSLSQIILFHFLGGSNITFIYNLKFTLRWSGKHTLIYRGKGGGGEERHPVGGSLLHREGS